MTDGSEGQWGGARGSVGQGGGLPTSPTLPWPTGPVTCATAHAPLGAYAPPLVAMYIGYMVLVPPGTGTQGLWARGIDDAVRTRACSLIGARGHGAHGGLALPIDYVWDSYQIFSLPPTRGIKRCLTWWWSTGGVVLGHWRWSWRRDVGAGVALGLVDARRRVAFGPVANFNGV